MNNNYKNDMTRTDKIWTLARKELSDVMDTEVGWNSFEVNPTPRQAKLDTEYGVDGELEFHGNHYNTALRVMEYEGYDTITMRYEKHNSNRDYTSLMKRLHEYQETGQLKVRFNLTVYWLLDEMGNEYYNFQIVEYEDLIRLISEHMKHGQASPVEQIKWLKLNQVDKSGDLFCYANIHTLKDWLGLDIKEEGTSISRMREIYNNKLNNKLSAAYNEYKV